ncbi:MAG: hypothetical protein UHX00_13810 [Caryophanon sp.]|nr:hypothetical protein [Caryophanon sp.]
MFNKDVIYLNVTQEQIDLFDSYWEKHIHTLPPLPTLLHDSLDQKIAVLNTWIGFSLLPHHKLLKSDKSFTHSFTFQLIQILYSALPEDHIIIRNPHNDELHFFFAYYVMLEVLHELGEPLEHNAQFTDLNIRDGYYRLNDEDLAADSYFYELMKYYNTLMFYPKSEIRLRTQTLKRATAALSTHASLLKAE